MTKAILQKSKIVRKRVSMQGNRDVVIVKALAPNRRGPGSNPFWCPMWDEFAVSFLLALKILLQESQHFQISIESG